MVLAVPEDDATQQELRRFVCSLDDEPLTARTLSQYDTVYSADRSIGAGLRSWQGRQLREAAEDLRAERRMDEARGTLRRFLYEDLVRRSPPAPPD